MTRRFRQPIWILPLAFAGLVALVGWWGNLRLRQTIEAQLHAELQGTLKANVSALEFWMTNQMKLAKLLAEEPQIKKLGATILEHAATNRLGVGGGRQGFGEFGRYLDPRLREVGYDAAQLVVNRYNTNYLVAANIGFGGGWLVGTPVAEAHTNKFAELFASGEPVIITPYKPGPPPNRPNRRGNGRNRPTLDDPGGGGRPRTNDAGNRAGQLRRGRGQTNSMPVDNFPPPEGPGGEFAGANGFPPPPEAGGFGGGPPPEGFGGPGGPRGTNGPPGGPEGPGGMGGPDGPGGPGGRNGPGGPQGRRGDLTLMQVAAPVRDATGTIAGALALIINPDKEFSRILSVANSGESGETYAFDQSGLLISRSRFDDELHRLGILPATNATSALNLRLHDPGAAEADGAKPLTFLVASAIAGTEGDDVDPTRDYRGVPVVGAWRWLPHYGFGVATQIDATEAYRSLNIIKMIFIALFLLLVLCSGGMFVFSYANVTWRKRLNEVESQLKQLGQYTLEEKIGEGGMGVVYRARHALMRRDTAVKLLLPDRADAAALQRFEREVCLTCQLTHPNTIQVYDYGHTPEGVFYYAMEFLRGMNLHDLVARYGPLPEGRVIHILTNVCEALAEAHALGLVHRDIKPANIFLCERGGVPDCVKVLDFGLVREFRVGKQERIHTQVGDGIEGTPSFMPPEAIKHTNRSDPRGDIYSVGALGYFLLTGTYVFESDSVLELFEKHLTETVVPPSRRSPNPVSAELEETLLRCLEKEPNLRPQSAAELRNLLLTSPRAADWTLAARAAWWRQNTDAAAGLPPAQPASSMDATVKIDFATRMG